MTVTGGEPPSFPRVGDSRGEPQPSASSSGPSLFGAPAQPDQPPMTGNMPTASSERRGSRLRWIVAGVATLFVLAIVGGVILIAAPRAGTASEVAHYAPADTAEYFEIRLDLPGDQHQNLATFMSHFPGFADQSALQQKLDDTLDTMLRSGTSSQLDWNNDVKPWFGGQLAMFGSPGASQDGSASMAVVLTVSDRSKLEAALSAHLGSVQPTSVDYQGTQIETIGPAAMDGEQVSYAVTDSALIAGTNIDQVKQALDVHAGQKPALADDAFFTQQLGQLHADRLATFYYDAGKTLGAMEAPPMGPDGVMLGTCLQSFESAAKVKYVGELRAEADHLAFTVRSQLPSGPDLPAPPANKQTTLAQSMPADTIAYFETRNTGANIDSVIKQLLSCSAGALASGQPMPSGLGIPGGVDPSAIFQQVLGTTPDSYFDFIDDAALGVMYRNATWDGGIVATVDDQAVATQRVAKLTSLLGLVGSFGGGSGASGITTEQVDHNGTTITVIHFSPGSDGSAALPGGGPVDLAVATTNGKLYLGLQDFVTSALDQDAANSLASSSRYQKAISAAPQSNTGILFLDVAALRDARAASMTDSDRQQYEQNVKPFLAPLDSLSAVSHIDGGMVVTNGFLYVE